MSYRSGCTRRESRGRQLSPTSLSLAILVRVRRLISSAVRGSPFISDPFLRVRGATAPCLPLPSLVSLKCRVCLRTILASRRRSIPDVFDQFALLGLFDLFDLFGKSRASGCTSRMVSRHTRLHLGRPWGVGGIHDSRASSARCVWCPRSGRFLEGAQYANGNMLDFRRTDNFTLFAFSVSRRRGEVCSG